MLRLPEQADRHLQQLMDRNHEGQLTEQERADLAALADLCTVLRSSLLQEASHRSQLAYTERCTTNVDQHPSS